MHGVVQTLTKKVSGTSKKSARPKGDSKPRDAPKLNYTISADGYANGGASVGFSPNDLAGSLACI